MRLILKGLAITVVVIILLLAAAVGYVWQHQELITEKAEIWYSNHFAGALELGEVRLNSWREWPFLQLEIDNISLRDTSWQGKDSTTLEIARLTVALSLRKIFERKLYLEKITIEEGHLLLLTAEDGTQNTGVFRELQPDFDADDEEKEGFLHLEQQSLKVEVKHFNLVLDKYTTDKHKRMAGYVQHLTTEVTITDTMVVADVATDMCMEGLGFNLAQGYYLADSPIQAAFQLSFDRRNSMLEIPQFPFRVGEQTFLTEICMDRTDGGAFHISLVNDETDFSTTTALLPEQTRKKLARYRVKGPLATAIMLRGAFIPGNIPWVQVDFTGSDNRVVVDGQVFSHFRGKGHFANRINDDPVLALQEGRKNLKLSLEEAYCNYKGARLYFPEATFRSTLQVPSLVDFVLDARGKLDDLNTILGNENFFFRGGDFYTRLDIVSTEKTLDQMLRTADGLLHISDTKVEYLPAGVTVPLTELEVLLTPEDARVPNIRIPLGEEQEIKISGIVRNFGSLIFEDQQERVESDLHVYSADLDFDNFMALLKELQSTEEVVDTQQTRLGETVEGIYRTFLPNLSLQIDHFAYQGLEARDISAKVAFLDETNIQLDSTRIFTGDSEIFLRGVFSVPDKQQGMQVDMNLKAKGNTHDFNKAFANDTFLFEEGDYHFEGRLSGNINNWNGLLHTANGRLFVQNTSVYYTPEKLRFPVDHIEVEVAQQDIVLDSLTLGFLSGDKLHLTGRVDNFMDILSGAENPLIRSVLGLKASYLDYSDFSNLFSSLQKDDRPLIASEFTQAAAIQDATTSSLRGEGPIKITKKSSKSTNELKKSLQNMYQKFYPELAVQIDSFRHGETLVTDIETEMSFQGREVIQFADMGFTYLERPVRMKATLGLADENHTPVDLKFTTSRFDLGALVETYDYFGFPALQSAEKIAGKVSLKAELRGYIVDSIGMDTKSLMGAIQFTLHEAELVNFEPIQKIANKFFRKERFESIRFAPITDTLYITQEVVHIPRMEIQSTAFNLFVEGHLNYDNNTNIWVSVPLQNFSAWEEGIIPLRRGYYSSGSKIFVEVRGNDEGELDYKFRLRKKKWYHHQGILPLYKEDRRYEREMRKQFRRERRKAKRLLRRA